MKTKQIAWVGFIALMIGVVIWRFTDGRVPNSKSTETAQKKPQASSDGRGVGIMADKAANNQENEEKNFGENKKEGFLEKGERIRQEFNLPISFYGKVIDEKRNPVSEAAATFSVTDTSKADPSLFKEGGKSAYKIQSDAQGLFSLTGIKGGNLTVRVSKEGYYTPSGEYLGFVYNSYGIAHIPDPKNPVIFRLHKKGVAAELVHREKLFTFSIDGTKHSLDLLAGKKTIGSNPQSDFVMNIVRSNKNADGRFDWEVVFEALGDGGFVESNEEFMLQAPESGYQPSLRFGCRASDPGWRSEEKCKFFLRSRQGKFYTRLEATIIPEYNEKGAVDLNYYLNPDGSRNLEYDKSKEIEVIRK